MMNERGGGNGDGIEGVEKESSMQQTVEESMKEQDISETLCGPVC